MNSNSNRDFIEHLRSTCRYNAVFMIAWSALTIMEIYYGYALMSAVCGAFTYRHATKAWSAFKLADLISTGNGIEVYKEDEEENE